MDGSIERLGELAETFLLARQNRGRAALLPNEFASHLMAASLSEKFALRHNLRVGLQPYIVNNADDMASVIMLTAACRVMAVASWPVTQTCHAGWAARLAKVVVNAYMAIYYEAPSAEATEALHKQMFHAMPLRLAVPEDYKPGELSKCAAWLARTTLVTGEQRSEYALEESMQAALQTLSNIAQQLERATDQNQREALMCAMTRHTEQWLRRLSLEPEAMEPTLQILDDGLKLLFGALSSN